jgi:hypothetical protein
MRASFKPLSHLEELTMNGAVMTIARYFAREAVKREMYAKGIKLREVEACEISRAAIVHLDNHLN